MCASSVALWGVSAAFQSYKARLISEVEAEQLDENTKYPLYKELILHGPLPTLLWLCKLPFVYIGSWILWSLLLVMDLSQYLWKRDDSMVVAEME